MTLYKNTDNLLAATTTHGMRSNLFYYSCYILGVNAEYTCTNVIPPKIHKTELGLDH